MMIYGFRDRENVLAFFEKVTGLRMNHNYIRPGGVAADLPDGWRDDVLKLCDYLPPRLDEYDVLYQLRGAGRALRMSELAARVLISRPSTTRVADHLVRRGWLERRYDDADRRVVLVGLTREGGRAQARAARLHLDGIARLVESPLEGHELHCVSGALRALAADRTPAARSRLGEEARARM